MTVTVDQKTPEVSASTPASTRTSLVLLGTKGGPRPGGERAAPGQVIQVDDVYYLIDCGNGVCWQLAKAGVPLNKIRNIFLTHHHSDHNADYGNVLLLSWACGRSHIIDCYGPPPIATMTRMAFEMNSYDISIRIEDEGRVDPRNLARVHEYSEPGLVLDDGKVRVTAALVPHPPVTPNFAYRFDTPDRSIVISGDTAPSDALVELARGADILVHEALYAPGIDALAARVPNATTFKEHLLASHTSTSDLGKIATRAGVKTLVLSHLVPGDDPLITDEMWSEDIRRDFDGEIIVGRDLMRF
ncbi:MAG: MBL fold metallo-hydrolase [Proteobacteria bacterium]|nr:MBL fold metallo-hydrolase [Pseudomonadota bacterium]